MEKMREHVTNFMKMLEFPEKAQNYFEQTIDAIENDEELYKEINLIIQQFFDKDYNQFEIIMEKLNHLAHKAEIHPYSMHFIFFMYCSQTLRYHYQRTGISEDVFWNTMLDLRCKLIECYNIHGIWGIFVAYWYPQFYHMQRFGLGRFQYEYAVFPYEDYQRNGFTVHKGDRVFDIHIPSSGSMNCTERMDSYRKAYEFFKDELHGKPIVFVCNSWLLFPNNEVILSEGSNIVDFMHDFDIISSTEGDTFLDAWRIFGKEHVNPVEQLPRNTSMQRAYADWLKDGKKTGVGIGIMLFDGVNII